MKKLLTYLSFLIAIASFGGIITTANAQSISPAEAAQLQATLNSVSEELAALQAQANAQAGSNGTNAASGATLMTGAAAAPAATTPVVATAPTQTATLSAADMASINSALSSLVTALSGLETSIAENPQVASTNAQGISLALEGIGQTLASIGTTIGGGNVAVAAPAGGAIAQSSPSHTGSAGSATAGNGSVAATKPSTAQSGPSVAMNNSGAAANAGSDSGATNNTVPTTDNTAPTAPQNQVAQASAGFSLSSIRWPYVVAGILVILAVALWLFWPGEDEDKKGAAKKSGSNAPSSKPAPAAQSPQMTILASSGKPMTVSPTPMASMDPSSAPKPEIKIVTPQTASQQQQRKPA